MNNRIVCIRYCNHAGVESIRRIEPLRVWFGTTRWHPERQWMLRAIDLDKDAMRDFALRDILSWGVEEPSITKDEP